MPPSELRVPVEAIRREAGLARDASSLRAVARDAGMTAMGLRSFLLDERKPQPRTLRKLTSWYGRRMATRLPEGEDEARAALIILAGYYPERERPPAILEFLDSMERRFRANGMEVPDWLDRLRREARGDAD
jgi:transcriptional regulator with XRE-family HTH domain